MFSRAGLSRTRSFIRLSQCFQSLNVKSFNRWSDVIPVRRTLTTTNNKQMPKKEKAVKGQAAAGAAAEEEASCLVSRDKSGSVSIVVHVKPGSKHSGVNLREHLRLSSSSALPEVSSEAVGVAVAAPPMDGEANAELLRYLAEVLDLKKSRVSLDKGSTSRDKLIKVDSSLSPEEVLRRLREAAG